MSSYVGDYQLRWNPSAIATIRQWADQAKREGFGRELAKQLRLLESRLLNEHSSFGDFLWSYRQIDAVERRGLIPRWFLVWYGVDDSAKQIAVHSLKPAPGSPLF